MTDEQFKTVIGVLVEIRDLLLPVDEVIVVEGCQHERKVDFSTPGDPHHFICPDCKLEWRAGRMN